MNLLRLHQAEELRQGSLEPRAADPGMERPHPRPDSEEIETPETVAGRIRRALEYVPAARLKPSTDCGLVPRSRAAARGKMHALAAGAAIVRTELADSLTPARHL